MSIIESLAGCEHGSKICFEIDWENGEISAPFVRYSHEQNSAPEHVWHGRAAYFSLSTDVLAESDWDRLKDELAPLVEQARAEFSTKVDDGFNERGQFSERGQEILWSIENTVQDFVFDAEYGIFDPADYFEPVLSYFDEGGEICPSTVAVGVTVGGVTEVTAFTTDSELDTVAERLVEDLDEGIVLTRSVREWLDDLRAELRAEDEQWGDLRPALDALIEAGDPRVRYKSQHPKYNPEPGRTPTVLIATHPRPGPSQFEPAILDATGDALRQWWRAGLDFPSQWRDSAERQLLYSALNESARFFRETLDEHDCETKAGELKREIDRLEAHLDRLKQKLDTLSPDRLTARAAALSRALARMENALFAPNGPEFSAEIRDKGGQDTLRMMLSQGRDFLPADIVPFADDWLVARTQANRNQALAGLQRSIEESDSDNPVVAVVAAAVERVNALRQAAETA